MQQAAVSLDPGLPISAIGQGEAKQRMTLSPRRWVRRVRSAAPTPRSQHHPIAISLRRSRIVCTGATLREQSPRSGSDGTRSLLCAFCSPSAREACARKIPALLNFRRFRLGSSLLCAARWLSMIQARLPPNLASPPLASCRISAAIEWDSACVVRQRRFGTSPIDQGRSERRSRGKVVAIRVMLSEGESRKRRCLTAKMRCCSGRERERERKTKV